MKLKKSYKYEIVLSLANREVNIGEIRNEIEDCIREFNIRSRVAKNVKNIMILKKILTYYIYY